MHHLLGADEVRLLTQVGYLAAGWGRVAQAECIFAALQQERPQQSFALLGVPTALLNAGRHFEAVQRLQAIAPLPEGEEADMVGAFLGLALQLDTRNAQAQQVLRPLAEKARTTATASPGARLAAHLLGTACT